MKKDLPSYIIRSGIAVFWLGAAFLFYSGFRAYPGDKLVYVGFAAAFNALLYLGFCRGHFFFDSFVAAFLWLGFFFKFSIHVAFNDSLFLEPTGLFDFKPASFDRALLVATCGAAGLVAARLFRQFFIAQELKQPLRSPDESLVSLYSRHRGKMLTAYVFLFLFVACTNFYFGIYQRGVMPKYALPPGVKGIYTWLILFGMTSFAALLIVAEAKIRRSPIVVLLLSILQVFTLNVSMMSRAFIVHASILIFGTYRLLQRKLQSISLRDFVVVIALTLSLFYFSFKAVTNLRSSWFFKNAKIELEQTLTESLMTPKSDHPRYRAIMTSIEVNRSRIWVDRWLGMEGVFSVSSYPGLGMDLWKRAWQEKYQDVGTSLYDREINKSGLENFTSNTHWVNMPGAIGFLFYPGSFWFLFAGCCLFGIAAALCEQLIMKLTGNVIVCCLMGHVIAERFAHFGYVPRQSYLLFGSMFLNVFMIVAIYKLAKYLQTRSLVAKENQVSDSHPV